VTAARGEGRAAVALLAAFLLVRLFFLVVREPFFDELFTLWMAAKPLGEILPALRLDSGPPLYYLVARFTDLGALRLLSLAFATAGFVALILWRSLGPIRLVAAALLAVYPPAVIYAADARAYAMCAALIGVAVLLVDAKRPFAAAAALVVAAYAHFLAVLFLPILLLRGRRGAAALVAAGLAFVPGAWLALSQPEEALAWQTAEHPLSALFSLSFVGNYPESLLRTPPQIVVWTIAGVTLVALSRAWRFAPYVLIPIAGAVVLAISGRDVYTPLRFESLLAVPLVLWLADSLSRWRRSAAVALAVVLVAGAGFTLWRGGAAFYAAPQNRWVAMVRTAEKIARRGEPLVVTGYYVLPAAVTLDRPFVAMPPEQLAHPGWRVTPSRAEAERAARALPAAAHILLADAGSEELRAVARVRGAQVIHRDGPAVIAHVPESRQ
jgi:hypothetical protein